MKLDQIYTFVGNLMYAALAINALWGAYCAIIIWNRINRKRFKSESSLMEFLEGVFPFLSQGNLEGALNVCHDDERVVPQLITIAIENYKLGFNKCKQLVMDRFQRDIVGDLENRLAWVVMMIKTAPMLGLLGTVLGMMGAFGKLAAAESVKPTDLAGDINVALITTSLGLAIAIPLMLAVAAINIRMRKMEENVTVGMPKFFDAFQNSLNQMARRGR